MACPLGSRRLSTQLGPALKYPARRKNQVGIQDVIAAAGFVSNIATESCPREGF
jgi:hypothetical protein